MFNRKKLFESGGFNSHGGFGAVVGRAMGHNVGQLDEGYSFKEGDKVVYEMEGKGQCKGVVEDSNPDDNGMINVSGVRVPLNKIKKA